MGSTLTPEVLSKYKNNRIFLETGSHKGDGIQLIKELSTIKTHTIMIDDMRVFRTKEGWGQYNPVGQAEIEAAILAINPNYKICYEANTVQADDILVAYIP